MLNALNHKKYIGKRQLVWVMNSVLNYHTVLNNSGLSPSLKVRKTTELLNFRMEKVLYI